MMNYLKFYGLCILLLVSVKINAQEAFIKTEKLNYKIDEEIKLVFEVTKDFDSISSIDLSDFIILEGPKKTIENSILNGVTEYKQKLSFRLVPKSNGKFTINPPIYYFGNSKVVAKKLTLTIEESKLTNEDKRIIELKKVAEKISKPEGTIRFVIIGKVGYVEELRNNKWEFNRELSKKEIKKLSKK